MRKTKHNRKNKKRKTRNKRGGAESGCRHCPMKSNSVPDPDTCSKCYFEIGPKKYKCQYHTSKKRCAGTTGGMFAFKEEISNTADMMSVDPKEVDQRHKKRLAEHEIYAKERAERAAARRAAEDEERRERQDANSHQRLLRRLERERKANEEMALPEDERLEGKIKDIIDHQTFNKIDNLKALKHDYSSKSQRDMINQAIRDVKQAEMEGQRRAKEVINRLPPQEMRFETGAAYRPTDLTNRYATYAEEQGGGGKKSRKNNRKKSHKNNRKKSRRK